MIIKFLDTKTLGFDLEYDQFNIFGDVYVYDFTKTDDVINRCIDAEVLVTNKIQFTRKLMQSLPKLRLICLTSTGTNTVDLIAAKELGVVVKNINHYSTASVLHLTFAMLFRLLTPLDYYDQYVKKGDYINDFMFTHYEMTWSELSNKTFGIVGMGHIGQAVARVATAFGATVIYYSTSGNNHLDDYREVSFDTLVKESDIISVHAPLNKKTENLFHQEVFSHMKDSAIIMNLGRGPIVNEEDLIDALNHNEISAAALDVIAVEPMEEHHCLRRLKVKEKLLITPHVGWASVESRRRMLDEVYKNIQSYLDHTDYQSVV